MTWYNCVTRTGHGGFQPRMRAPADFTYKIPDGLDSAVAAPLLCAGITVRCPPSPCRLHGPMLLHS